MFKRGQVIEDKSHHLDACFLDLLLPIYHHYTTESMLEKLVPGQQTNCLEAFNSLLWSILTKRKLHGTPRTEIAVILAIMQYEDGKIALEEAMEKLEISSLSECRHFTQHDQVPKKLKVKRQSDVDVHTLYFSCY